MPVNYFFVFLASFLAGVFFIRLFKKFALKYNILSPGGIPLAGGIGAGLSFFAVCLPVFIFCGYLSREISGILLSSFIMLLFGIIDDKRELSVSAKLLVQIISAAILVAFGIKTQIVDIGNLLNIALTFIWILAISNAFNHLDIIDGLAAGVALISSAAFFVISVLNNDVIVAVSSLTLTGAILSFLIYNLPPARIYLGNSGSHFLGFILAAIALLISYAPMERKVALFSPLLILGFPIFDTTFLILMRLRKKRIPFKKSDDHFALRLLRAGHSKTKTLILMLLLCSFFASFGILLSRVSNLAGAAAIFFVILACLWLTLKMAAIRIDG